MILALRVAVVVLLLGAVLGTERVVSRRGKVVAGAGEEVIPEFFEDGQNVVILLIGVGIVVGSMVVSLLIYKCKGRSAAFENSLFQNLEEEN